MRNVDVRRLWLLGEREIWVTYVHSIASGRNLASVAFCESLIHSEHNGWAWARKAGRLTQ